MGGTERVNVSTLDSLGLALALQAVFDEVRDCESPEHFTRPEGHAGIAEWYVHVKHDCGHDVVRAYCDKFKQMITSPVSVAICGGCGVQLPASIVIRNATRMGS